MTDTAQLYEKLSTIRSFETLLLDEFASGIFPGTTHISLGHEANAVGVLAQAREKDVVVNNHRCHGHFLAYGGDPTALYAELMGKPDQLLYVAILGQNGPTFFVENKLQYLLKLLGPEALRYYDLHRLAYEHESFAELVIPTRLSPVLADPLFASLRRTGRVAAREAVIPVSTELEVAHLPQVGDIIRQAREMVAA